MTQPSSYGVHCIRLNLTSPLTSAIGDCSLSTLVHLLEDDNRYDDNNDDTDQARYENVHPRILQDLDIFRIPT